MKRTVIGCALAGLALVVLASRPVHAQDLQQKLAAAKNAAAANQAALRAYTWLEKTELRLKGEVKATKIDSCRYGPDGKVQKTPVVEPPPKQQQRGLKGRVVAKKTGEMKEELEASAALIHQYVPPDPGMMQVVMNAGTASLAQAGPSLVALTFQGYAKTGDALTLTFEREIKSLREIGVDTWLGDATNRVTMRVVMDTLPDGTNYPATVALTIPDSKIEVRVTKSNYQKLAQ